MNNGCDSLFHYVNINEHNREKECILLTEQQFLSKCVFQNMQILSLNMLDSIP